MAVQGPANAGRPATVPGFQVERSSDTFFMAFQIFVHGLGKCKNCCRTVVFNFNWSEEGRVNSNDNVLY